jgi:hypothetical protein
MERSTDFADYSVVRLDGYLARVVDIGGKTQMNADGREILDAAFGKV